MKKFTKHIFRVATVLLFILSTNGFLQAQNNADEKSKLDISVDRNGQKFKIDTLIDASQIPQLFEELNKELEMAMPEINQFFEQLDSKQLNQHLEQFEQFFNEDFGNAFQGMFKELENLNLDNLKLDEAFGNFDELLKNFESEIQGFNFNFEGLEGLNFDDNFNFDNLPMRSNKAQLGVTLSEKELNGNKTITVNEVSKNSIADKAGILKGDKLTTADGKKINSIIDVVRAIQTKQDKEILKLGIERNGIPTILDIEIDVPKSDKLKETIKKV